MVSPTRTQHIPTVWLHGAGLNRDIWDPARARGIRLDLPGHGVRPRAKAPSVTSFAEAILADCPDYFDIVGHSLGGMVAQEIAAHWPERVRRLVLVESWPGQPGRAIHVAGGALSKMLASSLGPKGVGSLSASYQRGDGKRLVRDAVSAMDSDALEDAMRAATSFDGWGQLGQITAPTLVMRGKKNAMTYWLCEKMAKDLPNGQYLELPGGHQLFVDCAAGFYEAVDHFLTDGAE